MAVNNNLYPGIVDTYMPAFLADGGDSPKSKCRVYFSLSSYNTIEDIENIQVTIRNQATNLSVLNPVTYPCEVMLTNWQIDNTRKTDDKYFFEITKEDMVNNVFELNQYYKVQFRFTSKNASHIEPSVKPQQIDAWLTANINNFSEWSTVCLIRGISTPTLRLDRFENPPTMTYLTDGSVEITGHLTFADSRESETLKSYQIKLYDAEENLLTDSGLLYNNNYSGINQVIKYVLKYRLNEGDIYTLAVDYETQNLYSDHLEYPFTVVQNYAEKLDATLAYDLNDDDACIGVNIKANVGAKPIVGNITIRRSSSESNFTIWEDVYTFSVAENQELDYTWYDYTVESGIWYKYCAQKRSSSGQRGVIVELNEPKMLIFDDMYLTGPDRQLRIRLNPTVSSFKRNVVESNTVTIGGKFPFIKRNGYTYYRSFPIGGLISSQMETGDVFTTKLELYYGEENVQRYEKYNKEHRISEDYDFTYEREFREKVEEFLMDNTVKLFRSPTEGNILVKLMDVNFQPNQTLGRRLWSFTATAYEIDEYSIDNCDKYHIQSIGGNAVHMAYPDTYFGQLSDSTIPANAEIIDILRERYQQHAQAEYTVEIENISYLRIEMESKPYLIYDSPSGPRVGEPETMAIAANPGEVTYLGYIVYINHMPIVINAEGIYELTNEGTEITSLYFPVDTKATIDFNVNIIQIYNDDIDKEEEESKVKSMSFNTVLGQMWGSFSYRDSIVKQLWNKYYETYSDYGQSLYYLNDIWVEANPGTVIYVKEDKDFDYERHVIGPTALLSFENKNANILSIYFTGIHFELANDYEVSRDTVPGYVYKNTGITLDGNVLMRDYKLIRNGVYMLTPDFIEKHPEKIMNSTQIESRTIQSSKGKVLNVMDNEFNEFMTKKIADAANRYIWYNDKFWLFTQDDDLLCPVEAAINYTCDIMKESYE